MAWFTAHRIREVMTHKNPYRIVALFDRGGEVRVQYMLIVTAENVRDVLARNADRTSRLHNDGSRL